MNQQFELSETLMGATKCRIKQTGWLFLATALAAVPAGYAQEASGVPEARQEAVESAQSGLFRFDIPAQALASALAAFGETTNLQFRYDAALMRGLSSNGVSGTYTPEEALRMLLAETDLTAIFSGAGTVRLTSGEGVGVVLPEALPAIIVTGTRSLTDLSDAPQATTVVSREQIEQQVTLLTDLGEILAKTVPGMSTSTEGLATTTQTLRGRHLFVLIDGVPQTVALRNGRRGLKSIDPSVIERIEVLSGATAIYGLGGTGGIINIITKSPGEGPPQLRTEVTLGFAPANVGESLRKRLVQQIKGGGEIVDYIFSVSGEQIDAFFDGDGDRIPTDTRTRGGETDAYNLFGKLGFDLGVQQRLEVSVNYYDIKQDTDFVLVPGVAGERKTIAVKGEVLGKDPATENLQANLIYHHDDVLGNRVKAQFFYRDHLARFSHFPERVYPGGGQTFLDSQRIGGRLDIETSLFGGLFLWGVDVISEETSQPFEDGRIFVPEMRQDTIGPFIQAKFDLMDDLAVSGGVRYETISFEVDDYTTVFGSNVEGGALDYDDTVFNLGAVYYFTDAVNSFVSFSQGFTVPEIGHTLRRAPEGTSILDLRPEPQVVNNYEVGVRGSWPAVQTLLSLFYSTSELGTSLNSPKAFGDAFQVLRSPERIYGVEASIAVQPFATWDVGGILSWMEGKRDADDDGSFETYLLGNRIPPLKVTAYIENETLPGWRNRVQVLYSGNRNRFDGKSGFGRGEVRDFVLLDLLSGVELNWGTLELGVRNLLDEQYIPVMSQIFNFDDHYTAGQGRTISATYSIDW